MKRQLAALALAALLPAGCGSDTKSSGPNVQFTVPPAAESNIKDALLLAAIKAKLAGEDIDSTTRIRVEVHGGDVVLHGRVPSAAAKVRAVQAARSVRGVKSVGDDLGVGGTGRSTSASARDLGLAAAVEASLAAQTGLNVARLRVSTKDGTVALSGQVPSAAVKSTMLEAVRATSGVRNVVDRITVK